MRFKSALEDVASDGERLVILTQYVIGDRVYTNKLTFNITHRLLCGMGAISIYYDDVIIPTTKAPENDRYPNISCYLSDGGYLIDLHSSVNFPKQNPGVVRFITFGDFLNSVL